MSLAQFYTTQNADTIAAFIINAGFGEVDHQRNMLFPNSEMHSTDSPERNPATAVGLPGRN